MERQPVPVLSLAAARSDPDAHAVFAHALDAGLRRFGFIVLRDHGIADALLGDAYSLAEKLFALPQDAKDRCAAGLRGYTPFGREHARDNAAPDLKEFWQIGRDATPDGVVPQNIWPPDLPQTRSCFQSLYRELDRLGAFVLAALEPSLALPRGWFAERIQDGNSILRIIHYPPLSANMPPGSLRSAAHEDINFITIMVAARGAGLELRDRDGQWLPVVADNRQLIVNTGDMLARLTNDRIAAKTHRVVNPSGPNVSRYSMPFFLHPEDSVSLAALPACRDGGVSHYPDITAGEYLAQRVREIGLVPGG